MNVSVIVQGWLARFVLDYAAECKRLGLVPDREALRTMARLAIRVDRT